MIAATNARLRLEGIAHSRIEIGHEQKVLAPLTRHFDPGLFHVVGGPSGVGKTTLLSILALAVRASRGTIHWGKDNLTALGPVGVAAWRRETLAMVFQTSRLIGTMSVAGHLRLTATLRQKRDAEAQGRKLIEEFDLGSKLHHVPAQLSGGEKQRVALAQALCFGPRLLLADEPTAALDAPNARRVAQKLKAFAQDEGAVVVCVSHDQTVIDLADEYIRLERPGS